MRESVCVCVCARVCVYVRVCGCVSWPSDIVSLQVDFLSDGLKAQINENKSMPFNFEHFKITHSLDAIRSHVGPKVCAALC